MFLQSDNQIHFGELRIPVVAVPVRDEADRLPELLNALARQSFFGKSRGPLPVVLVLNNCCDSSIWVARSLRRQLTPLRIIAVETEFPAERAHVGSARRLAMDVALSEVGDGGVLISTDADAVPPTDWVEANVRAISAGADLVGGLIIGDPIEEAAHGEGFCRRAAQQKRYGSLLDELASLIAPLPYDPWPRHADHTGASLAVRGDVYRKLGGIPRLPRREDVAFVTMASRAGFRLRHDPNVKIQVSARLKGRAKGGMADCIHGWMKAEELGLPHLVEDPAFALTRLLERPGIAISAAGASGRDALMNENGMEGVIGPQIDVEVAIERLEQMIAAHGIRLCPAKTDFGYLTPR